MKNGKELETFFLFYLFFSSFNQKFVYVEKKKGGGEENDLHNFLLLFSSQQSFKSVVENKRKLKPVPGSRGIYIKREGYPRYKWMGKKLFSEI